MYAVDPAKSLHGESGEIEVVMPAYLLLIFAVLSRLVPHHGWLNFTAVGGALLYFGARRSRREMIAPLVALMATDYVLTVFAYHYTFQWQAYVITWAWYLAAMFLGRILLRTRTTFLRVASGVVLGPTSFFLASNYAVWVAGDMYPRTLQRTARLLRRGDSVLPQRPDLDGHCRRSGVRRAGAGAPHEPRARGSLGILNPGVAITPAAQKLQVNYGGSGAFSV